MAGCTKYDVTGRSQFNIFKGASRLQDIFIRQNNQTYSVKHAYVKTTGGQLRDLMTAGSFPAYVGSMYGNSLFNLNANTQYRVEEVWSTSNTVQSGTYIFSYIMNPGRTEVQYSTTYGTLSHTFVSSTNLTNAVKSLSIYCHQLDASGYDYINCSYNLKYQTNYKGYSEITNHSNLVQFEVANWGRLWKWCNNEWRVLIEIIYQKNYSNGENVIYIDGSGVEHDTHYTGGSNWFENFYGHHCLRTSEAGVWSERLGEGFAPDNPVVGTTISCGLNIKTINVYLLGASHSLPGTWDYVSGWNYSDTMTIQFYDPKFGWSQVFTSSNATQYNYYSGAAHEYDKYRITYTWNLNFSKFSSWYVKIDFNYSNTPVSWHMTCPTPDIDTKASYASDTDWNTADISSTGP